MSLGLRTSVSGAGVPLMVLSRCWMPIGPKKLNNNTLVHERSEQEWCNLIEPKEGEKCYLTLTNRADFHIYPFFWVWIVFAAAE